MPVINHSLILDKDMVFDEDLTVDGQIVGPKYTLTVKGGLICKGQGGGKTIIVKNLEVSGDVLAGAIVAQKVSAKQFIGGTLIAREIIGQTTDVWHVERITE